MIEEELSNRIIRAALKVHSTLGPGLLENVYEVFLTQQLMLDGLKASRQVEVPVSLEGISLDCGCRLDILVNDRVIVELKAVERLLPIHHAQAITYLKLANKRLCLLFNFNVLHLRDGGIRRIVLESPKLSPSSPFP